ncbi:MAG: acyltransferase [Planctomycetes bacterium]|nr:acyltransferase [Planctomycetota bacterium]
MPSLDGLRAIAVLLVMWCHVPLVTAGYPLWLAEARFWVGPGGLGVELFFALSGFLITRILIAEREQGHPVRWFLLRRLLRIFPIYYLLLAVMAFWRPGEEILWCALYLGNFADVFAPTPGAKPLGHTWSLCVEEHFYLLWPLVVAWGAPALGPRVLKWGMIPVAVVGAVVVGYCVPFQQAEWAVERLSPFRFLTLACGALVAYAEPSLRSPPTRMRNRGLAVTALGVLLHPHFWFLLLPVFVLEVTWWPMELAPAFKRVHSAVLCTGLLMWCVTPRTLWLSPDRVLSIAPLRWIGRISYGLYLYHLPVYHWLLHPGPTPARAALAVGVTFAVATTSYLLVERPILNYASRFRHRSADR